MFSGYISKVDLQRQKVDQWLAGAEEQREWDLVFNGCRTSVWDDESSEMDDCDDCTNHVVDVLSATRLYNLQNR